MAVVSDVRVNQARGDYFSVISRMCLLPMISRISSRFTVSRAVDLVSP